MSYVHLNFSSRYVWGPTITFLLNDGNFGIFNDWDMSTIRFCVLGPIIIWDIFFENGSSKANLLTLDENIGSDYNGNCIYTGTAYRLDLFHWNTHSLLFVE